ncbi:sn-glycerol-3-phosphate ABC transporter ATP-binding protein UgpC [Christensenellaceae bacterium OttesenSCG-928-M15]|nr:sn-glycerol-3-phosphate ABC transporter ATP-binding protein UgpC [Christensenellaceae bacterium OttesenSCG-928-M15]
MASISLKNIQKIYPGNVMAVDDFNLEIDDREFIILVGPSGCGKSTTLRMIAGLEEISGGELLIDGRLVNDVPPKDRDIAMVFQNYALYPHMTVFKNMAFGLELRKTPKEEIKRRVNEAAAILDIEKLLNRKPKALSGGQRQRVALGRAMVRNPAVFLLDEPLSNLDAKLRASMRTELIKLHQKLETTFIYVTHDQTEAMTMGDRIVVMKDGLIQQVDTPQNLYDHPVNTFVAGFIGSPQMNFIDGMLEKDDKGYYIAVEDLRFYIPRERASSKLGEYIGRGVSLGIRPEDISNVPGGFEEEGHAVAQAQVELSELMGSEVYLYLNCRETSLIARVSSATSAKAGANITIAMDMKKAHLFDKESGHSLMDKTATAEKEAV